MFNVYKFFTIALIISSFFVSEGWAQSPPKKIDKFTISYSYIGEGTSYQTPFYVIKAKIKNPNTTSFTIYKSDLNVSINGLDAGMAHLTDNVKINGSSEETYIFKVKSDFSKLSLTDLPQLISIATSKNVRVGLKGDLHVGKFFYKKTVPVEFNESVPLSK